MNNLKLNPISFSVTYQRVTPESAEHGDYSEQGFLHEDLRIIDLGDIQSLIEEFGTFEPSCSPITTITEGIWLSSPDPVEYDYATGEETYYSLHPNNARSAKYLTYIARYMEIIEYTEDY